MPGLKNTQKAFGGISKGLHWSMALMILGLLVVGFWMTTLEFSPFKLELYNWHKSFGVLVLILASVRLVWRFLAAVPLPLSTHAGWEKFLSKTIHIVLYLSFFVMPLSGWLMSSAGEYPVNVFGLFNMPPLMSKDEGVFELMKVVHTVSAYGVIGALGLHIAGAVKHHVIDKDETLRRMGGNLVLAIFGGIILAVAALMAGQNFLEDLEKNRVAVAASDSGESVQAEEIFEVDESAVEAVQKWIIDPEASRIAFSFFQYGQETSGGFGSWSGDIAFDGAALERSRAEIVIDIGSIATGSVASHIAGHVCCNELNSVGSHAVIRGVSGDIGIDVSACRLNEDVVEVVHVGNIRGDRSIDIAVGFDMKSVFVPVGQVLVDGREDVTSDIEEQAVNDIVIGFVQLAQDGGAHRSDVVRDKEFDSIVSSG